MVVSVGTSSRADEGSDGSVAILVRPTFMSLRDFALTPHAS